MNLLFLNKTKYSPKLYELFLNFHTQKFGIKYLLISILGLISIIFILTIQLQTKNFLFFFLLLFTCLGFFFWQFIKPMQNVSKDFKSNQIKKKEVITFEFYEDFFVLTKNDEEYKKYYNNIYKVFEVNHFFYIYINRRKCFILDKSGFIHSDSKKFYTFISKKCKCRKEISKK